MSLEKGVVREQMGGRTMEHHQGGLQVRTELRNDKADFAHLLQGLWKKESGLWILDLWTRIVVEERNR